MKSKTEKGKLGGSSTFSGVWGTRRCGGLNQGLPDESFLWPRDINFKEISTKYVVPQKKKVLLVDIWQRKISTEQWGSILRNRNFQKSHLDSDAN